MKKFLLTILAVLIILAPSGCSKKKSNIVIATKPMTEQFILAEMLKILIEENTDLKVEIKKGIGGGTANIHPALLKGDFDMYPEYTGTAWNYVLKKTDIPDDQTLFRELTKEYKDKYNLEWVGMYGFNNTYGLIVSKDIADRYNLQTYSDLAQYTKDLTFGGEYDFFEREDGYDALCDTYGYEFRKQVDLDIGLKYSAINNKQIDVMNISTTDGQLSMAQATILNDDKNFYQTYYCGTVVRADTLKKYPELRKALMLMDNLLTEKEMTALNYEVENTSKDEYFVAENFLRTKGLIK